MARTTVTVTGHVTGPGGVVPTGGTISVTLSQPASVTVGAEVMRVVAGRKITLGANGAMPVGADALVLDPVDAMTPSGVYYVATYVIDLPGVPRYTKVEKWAPVSGSATIDIGAIPQIGVIPGVTIAATLAGTQAQADAASASATAAAGSAATATTQAGAASGSASAAAASAAAAATAVFNTLVTATGSGVSKTLPDWQAQGPVAADGTLVTATGGSPRTLADIAARPNAPLQTWDVADSTARLALVPTAADLGRVCRQTNDNSLWACVGYAPAAWRRVDPDDLSTYPVTATGSTTPDTLAARFAREVWLVDNGCLCDGVTNDYAALDELRVRLGTTVKRRLVVSGLCVVNTNITLPPNLQIEFVAGGRFIGTGTVTQEGTNAPAHTRIHRSGAYGFMVFKRIDQPTMPGVEFAVDNGGLVLTPASNAEDGVAANKYVTLEGTRTDGAGVPTYDWALGRDRFSTASPTFSFRDAPQTGWIDVTVKSITLVGASNVGQIYVGQPYLRISDLSGLLTPTMLLSALTLSNPTAPLPLAGIKTTAAATAPGAGYGALRWEAGTNAGTLKLVAYSGTSTTGVTVVDNVGAGN